MLVSWFIINLSLDVIFHLLTFLLKNHFSHLSLLYRLMYSPGRNKAFYLWPVSQKQIKEMSIDNKMRVIMLMPDTVTVYKCYVSVLCFLPFPVFFSSNLVICQFPPTSQLFLCRTTATNLGRVKANLCFLRDI